MMNNQLAKALNLTTPSRVDDLLNGVVSGSAAFVGGALQTGMGNPNIKNVPLDVAAAAALMMTSNPTAQAVAKGLTYGAFGRYGAAFGARIDAARAISR